MDDMKKAAYLRARELLETRESDYVCIALQNALEEILGEEIPSLEISEMFPEFHNLFDGFYWISPEHKYKIDNSSYVWWKGGWKEPRLRIIDAIMSQT